MRKEYEIKFTTWAMDADDALSRFKNMIRDKGQEFLKYGQTKDFVPVIAETGRVMPDTLREWLNGKLVANYVAVDISVVGNNTFSTTVTCKEDMELISPQLLNYYVTQVAAPKSTLGRENTFYKVKISRDFEEEA